MQLLTAYLGYAVGALLAILPIVNPLGAVPLVVSVAAHLPDQERLRQIRRACIYTFALMTGFLFAGSMIMSFFGISIPGMRIAGGMILAFLGFGMLFPGAGSSSGKEPAPGEIRHDIAFTPLAMPGLSGCADNDGAVVIPAAMVTEVTELALEQERHESWVIGEVRKGVPLPGLYPADAQTRARYEEWRKTEKS